MFIDAHTCMPVLKTDPSINLARMGRTIHSGSYMMPIYIEPPV